MHFYNLIIVLCAIKYCIVQISVEQTLIIYNEYETLFKECHCWYAKLPVRNNNVSVAHYTTKAFFSCMHTCTAYCLYWNLVNNIVH